MEPTAGEAAQALRDIELIRKRSLQLRSYQPAASQVTLWGVFWVIGYGSTDLAPRYSPRVWMAISVLGLLFYLFCFARSGLLVPASTAAGTSVRGADDARMRRAYRLRILGVYAVFCLLVFGTELIMQPHGIAMAAYVPLLVASVYIGAGLWGAGSRYVAVGLALAVLALGGYWLLPQLFLLLMAIIGGGALVLTGWWFRNA
jgi:hypothetical protein